MSSGEVGGPVSARGRLIVLEGPDGAGKSVQASLLAAHLRARGHRVTLTREPGGTRLGEAVRDVLLDPGPVARGPMADALLFNAARSQLVTEVIRPALERGEMVVCDRYAASSAAYQGHGSAVGQAELATLAELATGGLAPDLVILIDVPVEVGLARRDAGRADEQTRFEDELRHDLAFHRRVRAGYLGMAAADPERWRVVDGEAPSEAVSREVSRAVDAFLLQPGDHRATRDGPGRESAG
jgi:dTMP kinase